MRPSPSAALSWRGGILFFATLGACSASASPFDLGLLLVLGALGFAMRRFAIAVLPLIIGVILGPRLEEQLSEALDISRGDYSTLWGEPAAITCYVVMTLMVASLVAVQMRAPRHTARPPAIEKDEVHT